MSATMEFVEVVGWGSDRHAREVRAGRGKAALVARVKACQGQYLVETEKGVRRLILRGGNIYTRTPL